MKAKRISLTDRFFASYGLWQIVGVFGLLQSSVLAIYGLGTLVLLALLWLDRRSLMRAQPLQARLIVPRAMELKQSIQLEVKLTPAPQPEAVTSFMAWEAPVLPTLHFEKQWAPFQLDDSGDAWMAHHVVTAIGLGYVQWTSLSLVVRSRLRLWHQNIEMAIAPQGSRIHPSFRRLPDWDFAVHMANQQILTQYHRRGMRGRQADQFHTTRRYQYPDRLRHIDAKKSAKYGQLMTRIYDETRSHHLVVALDIGRSMCGKLNHSAKNDYYLSACLMLAQQAIAAGDDVSFFAFANTVTFSLCRSRHLSGFEPLFRGDERLRAIEIESRFDLLYPTICTLASQRSIVLVLTDLTHPSVQQALLDVIAPICQRHLTLAVGLQDRKWLLSDLIWELETDCLSEDDQARLLYAYWLNDQFQLFRKQMAQWGGGVVQGSDETWLSLTTQLYARLRESLLAA